MSKYTTGEIAKLCGVSVRTVQYYDSREILVPHELSEGGRRLYSEEDLKKMKVICFLREMGMSINSIGELFLEEHPENVIAILLDEQERNIMEELREAQRKLEVLDSIKKGMKIFDDFSVESINDIAYMMSNKKKLRRVRINLLLMGIPMTALEWVGIILWVIKGMWIPFAVYTALMIPFAIMFSRYYFNHVGYICPSCHTVFKPKLKEAFWASHTPTTRKLTCPCCSHKGHCVEVYMEGKEDEQN
ncbi:MAG: MerR family transcriptional regulator [Ruminococcaceae bacterium]|nr:MerR family transcriptional regulator [Oscillospiraceae bacterium]